ncbi:MAG: secretin N-terminal domain-containing protein [Thermoanaerobaculia bacterium]
MSRAPRVDPFRRAGVGARVSIVGLMVAALVSLGAAAIAQATEEIFTLRHIRAATALELVVPLLSATGSVELRQAANALVVRDTPEAIARIRQRLDSVDRPVVPLIVELQIFEGGAADERGAALALAPELAARLKELFRFDSYRLVASGRVLTREGENVLYQAPGAPATLGNLQVRFQTGRLAADGQLRLEAFRLERAGESGGWESLLSGRLRLVAGRPLVLALTRSEDAERALFLAITARATPARPGVRGEGSGVRGEE